MLISIEQQTVRMARQSEGSLPNPDAVASNV